MVQEIQIAQTITLFEALRFIGIILTIVLTGMGISRQIKKNHNEYVDNKMKVFDIRLTSLEKEVDDNKKDNQREHDAIKQEFVDRVNMIFEWIKRKAG
jgi:hypothetical protein